MISRRVPPGKAARIVRSGADGVQAGRGETPGMTIVRGVERVALVPEGAWEVDPARSTVGFTVRHLKVAKVRGRFGEITGVIRCDHGGLTAIDGRVEVASLDTGDHRRDARLCAEDFFDAERHPTIAFRAISEATVSGDVPVVRGTMTMRGVSRPLELQVDAPGSPVAGKGDLRIRANGVLSRRAFGLTWDSAFAAGGLVIDDRVGLQLDVVVCPRSLPAVS
jgi:polyisoprenoid-binding protein YceI